MENLCVALLIGGLVVGALCLAGIILLLCHSFRERKRREEGSQSVADELLKFKRLLDEGALTREEFERIKGEMFW